MLNYWKLSGNLETIPNRLQLTFLADQLNEEWIEDNEMNRHICGVMLTVSARTHLRTNQTLPNSSYYEPYPFYSKINTFVAWQLFPSFSIFISKHLISADQYI